MQSFWKKQRWSFLCLSSLLILAFLLISCGESQHQVASTSQGPAPENAFTTLNSATSDSKTGSNQENNQSSPVVGKQYLIKSLAVSLKVKDTRKVAVDLQQWLKARDKNITSSGSNYQQIGEEDYSISLTYSVPASDYDDVYNYLRDYTSQNGGQLTNFVERIEDVTNSYIDVQSRLNNLRTEQNRLQTLLTHAQSLSDILAIESKLSEVEGNIESYEAQYKSMTSQISFYDVSISLRPLNAPDSEPSSQGWSIGQALHDALGAALLFGQGVLTTLIWLLTFSLYLLPVAVLFWLVRRWQRRRIQAPTQPKAAFAAEPTPEPIPAE